MEIVCFLKNNFSYNWFIEAAKKTCMQTFHESTIYLKT